MDGHTSEFIRDQYRHCKPILVAEAADVLLQAERISRTLPDGNPDPGLIIGDDPLNADSFMAALAKHRHPERETDPPKV